MSACLCVVKVQIIFFGFFLVQGFFFVEMSACLCVVKVQMFRYCRYCLVQFSSETPQYLHNYTQCSKDVQILQRVASMRAILALQGSGSIFFLFSFFCLDTAACRLYARNPRTLGFRLYLFSFFFFLFRYCSVSPLCAQSSHSRVQAPGFSLGYQNFEAGHCRAKRGGFAWFRVVGFRLQGLGCRVQAAGFSLGYQNFEAGHCRAKRGGIACHKTRPNSSCLTAPLGLPPEALFARPSSLRVCIFVFTLCNFFLSFTP